MTSPLQVTNEDIKALRDHELVRLLWQLLNLELGTNQIEKYDSQVSLSIYIKDGGIDGIARWEGGPDKTTFLPSRNVGFQAKATDMSESACKSEVQTAKGLLKPQVRKLAESGGDYVLFIGRDCVEQSKVARIKALQEGIESASRAGGGVPLKAPNVKIYDASEIASWVNTYPASVAQVGYFLGKLYDGGMGWDELSKYPEFQVPYVEIDEVRKSATESIQKLSQKCGSAIRIVGSSGLGKTRLVFEAFRPPQDAATMPEQAKLSNLFCYMSATKTPNIEQLIVSWRRLNRRGVVIVDECTYELHERLCQEIKRSDSQFSIITIGNDRDATAYAGTETNLLVVEPTTDEAILAFLEVAYSDIDIEDRKFIATELAQGYPLMAILVAEARRAKAPLAARLTPGVLAKLLGREVAPGSAAQKVISVLSLFEYVGISDGIEHEREFVRKIFCPEVNAEEFYENIIEFQKCGAVSKYGRLVQVRPKPLAIRLAADWWEKCSPELATRIIESGIPEGLSDAFCDRLRMLDFVPALQNITQSLCGSQGPFGQAKVLNSELGSRLFRAIAEVNPVAAVNALWNVYGGFNESELIKLNGDVRRNLVWALEKLCFRTDTFDKAAQFLSRLASSENETWSNNATGVFKRLFMIHLSGTQAPLPQRLPILLSASKSESTRMREVAVTALENALRSNQFTGMSGPEYQGSSGPLPQYRPKTWGEVFEYWTSCLQELVRLAVHDPVVKDAAAAAIAANIRGLIQQGRLDDVEFAVNEIAISRNRIWPAALDGIKDSLRYEGKGFPEEARLRVESWLSMLEPTDLVGKLALHVTNPPYDHNEDEQGEWHDLAAERAEKLGSDCAAEWTQLQPLLASILKGPQRQAFMFGRGMAKGSEYDAKYLNDIVAALEGISYEERNSAALSGWLSAFDEVASESVDKLIGQLANRQGSRKSLPAICRGFKLNDFRVGLIISCLHDETIDAQQLHGISYGQAMSDVSPEAVSQLCNELLTKGLEGAWIALDIAFMYIYSDSTKWPVLGPTLKTILSTEGMLGSARKNHQIDTHAYAKVAEKLIEHDPEFARTITKEVVRAAAEMKLVSNIDHCLHEVLSALLEKQLDVVWPLISDNLVQIDNSSWRLADLIRDRHGRAGDSGLILKVPMAYLESWCEKFPDIAPRVLADLVNLIDKKDDDEWVLSDLAKFLIDRYGNNPSVLSALQINLLSFSWTGSLVPFYERQASVLRPLLDHYIAEVRHWSRILIDSAKQHSKLESAKDNEHEIGRYS